MRVLVMFALMAVFIWFVVTLLALAATSYATTPRKRKPVVRVVKTKDWVDVMEELAHDPGFLATARMKHRLGHCLCGACISEPAAREDAIGEATTSAAFPKWVEGPYQAPSDPIRTKKSRGRET